MNYIFVPIVFDDVSPLIHQIKTIIVRLKTKNFRKFFILNFFIIFFIHRFRKLKDIKILYNLKK